MPCQRRNIVISLGSQVILVDVFREIIIFSLLSGRVKEYVVHLSFRNKKPDIPWTKMAGMRDVLIHNYMGVDLKTVWKVATERLPRYCR